MSHEKFESKRKRMRVNYNEGTNLLHFTAGNEEVSDNFISSEDEKKYHKKMVIKETSKKEKQIKRKDKEIAKANGSSVWEKNLSKSLSGSKLNASMQSNIMKVLGKWK
jgi:hypothetical protein